MSENTKENKKRLEVLFRKHNDWLRAVTYNICGSHTMTDELVGELYLYLAEKGGPKLWYSDGSFNLSYCRSFLKSRFINKIKIENRYSDYEMDENIPDIPYNEGYDQKIDNTYDEIRAFLKSKQNEKDWVSAKIAELYYFGKGFTIEGLAKEVGVSRSTVFLHIKSMKKEIKQNIKSPFDKNELQKKRKRNNS